MTKIRTRIAPSPTGNLHIGTARTALFNYLFAKQNKGDFVLRFEDTDKERSTKEFEKDIREGFKWLGLDWDKEYRQMDRLKNYKKYADKLIKRGSAYEKDGAIWFKVPEKKVIEFKDIVRGKLRFETKEFKDFVIVKSDGIPTFYFSNVIDDNEMKISHVIRGEDHITNTPLQILISESLGFKLPVYTHIPLILNPDRSKLSKRKQAVSVNDYKKKGYLAESMINFFALMGWHPKGDKEFVTLMELIKEFRLDKVQKSPAIFDIDKLNSINRYYINKTITTTTTTLPPISLVKEIYVHSRFSQTEKNRELFRKVVTIVKDRLNNYSEFDKQSYFFFRLPDYDAKTLVFKKSNKEKSAKGLSLGKAALEKADREWGNVDKLNILLAKVVKDNNLTNGDVFWPVRVALSGLDKSPSPPELLWALGKVESIKRLDIAIKKLR